jgi:hypothetical protein
LADISPPPLTALSATIEINAIVRGLDQAWGERLGTAEHRAVTHRLPQQRQIIVLAPQVNLDLARAYAMSSKDAAAVNLLSAAEQLSPN